MNLYITYKRSDMHKNVFFPLEILQKIETYVGDAEIVNFATAFGINLYSYLPPINVNCVSPIITSAYITIRFNTVAQYIPILRLFKPKIGGSLLLYHIRRHNVDILMFLSHNCIPYFKCNHLLEAVKTKDINIVKLVFKYFVGSQYLINEHLRRAISTSIEINALDICNYIIDTFPIFVKQIKDILRFVLTIYDSTAAIYICDHYGINFEYISQYIEFCNVNFTINMIHTKNIIVNGREMFNRVISSFQYRTYVYYFSDIDLVKYVINYAITDDVRFDWSTYIFQLFIATTRYAVDASVWMSKNNLVDKKREIIVGSIEAFKALYDLGHNIIGCDKRIASTVELQKWYEMTTIYQKPNINDIISLSYGKKPFDLIEHIFDTNSELIGQLDDKLIVDVDYKITKLLLDKGYIIKNMQYVITCKMLTNDIEIIKYIHSKTPIHPCFYSNELSDDRVHTKTLKYICDTFSPTIFTMNKLALRLMRNGNVESLNLLIRRFDLKLNILNDNISIKSYDGEMQDFITSLL